MNIKEEMQMQIAQLNMWTKAYDEGHPLVSDKQWDEAYFRLIQLEENTGIRFSNSPSQKVIYEVKNKLNKVEHNHPMLSLAKTKDIQEVEAFIKGKNYIAMEKLDGLTCSLRYVNHKLVSAETRGNGLIGEDILHNMVSIVPKVISYEEELIIDGEIICDTETFEYNFSKDYKNPRNYAAGAIRRLDANENKESGLSFVAWDVIKGFNDCKLLSEKLDRLEQYGFIVVDYNESENVEHDINVIKHSAKIYAYPIDGVVFKYNNIEYYKSLGNTDHHFRGGLAFKFYDEEYETTLIDIEWTMGRTGILTPVAIYDDIDIEGSVCNRASLHNVSVMEETLGTAYSGQKIKVFKANMIIPQISWSESLNSIEDGNKPKIFNPPCECPICGKPTEIKDNDGVKTLWCVNSSCEGKLINIIDHFVGKKGLDVKGLSKATIEKLINQGWLNCRTDVFKLYDKQKEWEKLPGFGVKSVSNIINAIEGAKNTNFEAYLSSLGVPLIGRTISKELAKRFESYNDFRKAIKEGYDFSQLEGFGYEMNKALTTYDYTEADEIAEMLNFKQPEIQTQGTSAEGVVFCITGKTHIWKNRDELKSHIESIGGKVVGSMSSKVNYLINNDNTSTSAKNVAAQKAGIPIITEEEFQKLFDF